ncbi:hypothetical protein BH09DEP1_BH09DEP1_7750 [soil metagenome]
MVNFLLSLLVFVTINASAMTVSHITKFFSAKASLPVKRICAPPITATPKLNAKMVDYRVSPSSISSVKFEVVATASAYEATLNNEDQVACFYIISGAWKGEKWALLYQADREPVQIPSENFNILQNYHTLWARSSFSLALTSQEAP